MGLATDQPEPDSRNHKRHDAREDHVRQKHPKRMPETINQILIAILGLLTDDKFIGFAGAVIGGAVGSCLAFRYGQRNERLGRLRALRGQIERVICRLDDFKRLEPTSDDWGRYEDICRNLLTEISDLIVSTREDFPSATNDSFVKAANEYKQARASMKVNKPVLNGTRNSADQWWALRAPLNDIRDATTASFCVKLAWFLGRIISKLKWSRK